MLLPRPMSRSGARISYGNNLIRCEDFVTPRKWHFSVLRELIWSNLLGTVDLCKPTERPITSRQGKLGSYREVCICGLIPNLRNCDSLTIPKSAEL
jgi:hypothetical protein